MIGRRILHAVALLLIGGPGVNMVGGCCLIRWLGGAYFMLVTMLSIGYGDITPRTEAEIIVCMFCMIAGGAAHAALPVLAP